MIYWLFLFLLLKIAEANEMKFPLNFIKKKTKENNLKEKVINLIFSDGELEKIEAYDLKIIKEIKFITSGIKCSRGQGGTQERSDE
jgi:hypothetical protein